MRSPPTFGHNYEHYGKNKKKPQSDVMTRKEQNLQWKSIEKLKQKVAIIWIFCCYFVRSLAL